LVVSRHDRWASSVRLATGKAADREEGMGWKVEGASGK
jgi:hypothetical protein